MTKGFLPGPVLLFVDDHVLNPDSFIQNAFASVWTFVTAMWELFEPLLEPLGDSIANFLNTSPNIFGAAVILVIAYLLLKVVFFVQRTMLFFTRLVFKALWWAFVAALVSMAFQRGIGETAKDVADIVGKIVSGVLTVVDIWMTQYMAATNTANALNQPSFKVQGAGS